MHSELDAVTASYHRCRSSAGFFDTFYDRFLAKSPAVAEKFRNTDFKHQKQMLRESLVWMLSFNLGSGGAHAELEQLAERHSRREVDIPPRALRPVARRAMRVGRAARSGVRAGACAAVAHGDASRAIALIVSKY